MTSRLVAPAAGALGLVVTVLGTFLPWLHSGRATRNCYQASGVLRRLSEVHGLADTALRVAPALGAAGAVVIAGYAVGLVRSASLLGIVVGAAAAIGGSVALAVHGDGSVQPAAAGPATTLTGAIIVVLASALVIYTPSGIRVRDTVADPDIEGSGTVRP